MDRPTLRNPAVLLTILLLTSNCYLTNAALKQERSRLKLQLSSLENLEQDLSAGTFPGGQRHVAFKLGYDVLNSVLAGADGLNVPIPQDPATFVHFHEIRVAGGSTPLLNVHASASKYWVKIGVAATAIFVIDVSNPAQPMLRVRIDNIAPVLSWRNFTLFRMELARKILTTKADQLAVERLAFPLPLGQAVTLDLPAVDQVSQVTTRNNGSWIKYRVKRPAASFQRLIKIDRIVFLKDGIHVFATVS